MNASAKTKSVNTTAAKAAIDRDRAIAILREHAVAMMNAIDELKGWAEQSTAKTSFSGRDVVARLWNAAADTNTLTPQRKEALQTQLAWAIDSERGQERIERMAQSLGDRLQASQLAQVIDVTPTESLQTFLERLLVALANNLLDTISPSAEASGAGTLRVDWSDRDGQISWGDGDQAGYQFVPLARACGKFRGGLDEDSAGALATFLADEMRQKKLELPLFQLVSESSNEEVTLMHWMRQQPAAIATDVEPALEELKVARIYPDEIEVQWWKQNPELASLLDQVLCFAAVQEAEFATTQAWSSLPRPEESRRFAMTHELIELVKRAKPTAGSEVETFGFPQVIETIQRFTQREPYQVQALLALVARDHGGVRAEVTRDLNAAAATVANALAHQ